MKVFEPVANGWIVHHDPLGSMDPRPGHVTTCPSAAAALCSGLTPVDGHRDHAPLPSLTVPCHTLPGLTPPYVTVPDPATVFPCLAIPGHASPDGTLPCHVSNEMDPLEVPLAAPNKDVIAISNLSIKPLIDLDASVDQICLAVASTLR